MKQVSFVRRFVIGGVGLMVVGIGMLSSQETANAGWRLVICGPLLAAVGVYWFVRHRS